VKIQPPTDHATEIGLLAAIAVGVMILMGIGARKQADFDPSAYLVVLTLIVGAIKERWTQRSVDRMGQSLANAPPAEPPV
jgi:cation transport ATPase